MKTMATERNDKMETPNYGTQSTVSADTDDMAITPRSSISSDQSEFEQHTPTTNNNENQTGASSLTERRNVDEDGHVAAAVSLKSISTKFSHRRNAAPWYAVNINMFLDLATAMVYSLPKLFLRKQPKQPKQPVAAPTFPLLKTSFHQDVEGEYEELWLRSPGVRCSERTLVYMVPGNPGVVKAWLNFMSMVCSSNDFDGCVMSHLGHCSCSTKVFGIQDQIAHHSKMIKKHSESYQKVLVLSHSTGSFIILEITDTLVELGDRLIGIGLLTPALTRFPTVPYWIYSALFYTPIRSQPHIIKMNAPPEIWEVVQHGAFVKNMKNLLRDTLDILPNELATERLEYWRSKERKLFIIFSERDTYMKPDVQYAVRCCVESPDTPEPSVLTLSSISHCFVLSVEESKLVSYCIDQWIANKRFDRSTADGII